MGLRDVFRSKEKRELMAQRAALETQISYLRGVLSQSSFSPSLSNPKASNLELAQEVEHLKGRITEQRMKASEQETEARFKRLAAEQDTEASLKRLAAEQAFQLETMREDNALARELSRNNSTSQHANQATSSAFRNLGLMIFGVIAGGLVLIFLMRTITKLVVTSLEVVSETLRSPIVMRAVVTIVLAISVVIAVGFAARTHITHSNNARSVAETAIRAQKELESAKLQIQNGSLPLAIEQLQPAIAKPSGSTASTASSGVKSTTFAEYLAMQEQKKGVAKPPVLTASTASSGFKSTTFVPSYQPTGGRTSHFDVPLQRMTAEFLAMQEQKKRGRTV